MDPLIQQSIVSLVELSRYRLGLICHHLVNQLENISKVHTDTYTLEPPCAVLSQAQRNGATQYSTRT